MPLSRRFLSLVSGAAALASMLTLSSVTAASAQSRAPGDWVCQTDQHFGSLCLQETNNGYDASFTDYGVTDRMADFTLWIPTGKGWVGDQGAFPVDPSKNWFRSYFFATGYKSWAHLCLYSRDTPPIFAPFCTNNLNG